MVKSNLIEVLAAKCGITSSESEKYLRSFIHLIYETLRSGGEVKISGFGTFSVSHRESREGVNPRQPSQRIIIPKLNTPKFRAGEAFKAAVKLK
jgi:DNA-binding protein HU-beta